MLRPCLTVLCALPLVAAGGCTKKNPPASDEQAQASEADEGSKAAEGASPAAPVTGLGTQTAAIIEAATAAAADAPLLEHENILGHFMMANAVDSVKEIKEQAAPPSVQNMVDLEVLKSLTAMQLGERSTVAVNVDLTKPFGCVLVDSAVIEAPISCVVGYKGGAEGLISDLGDTGAMPDAKGHLAAFEVEGQQVFIDAIGDQVALSNHDELHAKSKDYLETNIIGRADSTIADFELVVFPPEALARYENDLKAIAGFLDSLGEDSPTGSPDLKKRLDEMDQFVIGIGLTKAGAHLSAATHATPGTDLATEIDQTYGGKVNADFVSKLPMSTFAFAAAQTGTGLLESEAWDNGVGTLAKAMETEFGMDADEIHREIERFVAEEADLYTRDVAMGMLYEPGTLGALVLEVGKKAPGRAAWKAWAERFTVDAVLPRKAREAIQWSFEPEVSSIEGVEIDRWTIGPTPKTISELGSDPDIDRMRKLWPDMQFQIDRAELDDRVIFIAAPVESDTYMRSAIAATSGGKTIRGRKGWSRLGTESPATTAIYAIDLAGGVEWLRPLLDASDAAEIPSPFGVALDDVTIALKHPAPGVVAFSFTMSQGLIDQLKLLADR